MPHFCSRNQMLMLGMPCTVSGVSYIMNWTFYLCLKMVKWQQLQAYGFIICYHTGNKAPVAMSSPRELSSFQNQAFSLPGSETQMLPEYIHLLRGRLTSMNPPKRNVRSFTDNEKYLSQGQEHIYCITSPFFPGRSTQGKPNNIVVKMLFCSFTITKNK